jgi:hypothetical protein
VSVEFDIAVLLRGSGFPAARPRLEPFEPVDLGQPGTAALTASQCGVAVYGWSGSGENDRQNREGMPSPRTVSDAEATEFSADAAIISRSTPRKQYQKKAGSKSRPKTAGLVE